MNKKNLMTGCLCALGAETIFGMSYVFTKQATGTASAFSFLGWRFVLAAVVMSVCVRVSVPSGCNLRLCAVLRLRGQGGGIQWN